MASDNNLCNSNLIEVLNKLPSAINRQDLITAGEKVVIVMYNGKGTLDSLRYQTFCKKVLESNKVLEANPLPPTSAAVKYHTMRVYCQVLEWKGENVHPLEWDWKNNEGRLVLIKTELDAAAKELLQIIRCSCKTGCTSKRYSGKKHEIPCITACKECKGVGCENGQHLAKSDNNIMF